MCMYCQAQVSPDRIEAGYAYCMSRDCVDKALAESRSKFRFVLMPKQGFAYVYKDSPDLLNGRSSGR
jgi:hypothetical protein